MRIVTLIIVHIISLPHFQSKFLNICKIEPDITYMCKQDLSAGPCHFILTRIYLCLN